MDTNKTIYSKTQRKHLTTLHTEHLLTSLRDFHSLHSPGEIPQAEAAVPGAGQGELSIRGDDHITYKVRVASQSALGDAIVGLITGQLPHDDRLVWKTNIQIILSIYQSLKSSH